MTDLHKHKKSPERRRREAYDAFLRALDAAVDEEATESTVEIVLDRHGAKFVVDAQKTVPIATSLKLV